METQKLYQYIDQCLTARDRCAKSGNNEWFDRWNARLHHVELELLPRGSGIDTGCKLDRDASSESKIIITSSVHMMDENGCYSGWQDFEVIVRPLFTGIDLTIRRRGAGNKRLWDNWIECLEQEFYQALSEPVADEIANI